MAPKSTFTSALLFILLMTLLETGFGQKTIQQQFDQFYEKETSDWQSYKMIKEPKLKNFWAVVSDSLEFKDSQISALRNKIDQMNLTMDSLNSQLATIKGDLAQSESVNDRISFLGMSLAKTFYNIIVWVVIFALIFGIVAIYTMFIRSNSVTKKMQKAYTTLESEYSDHQNRARENQVKLKRELQTALNTLHDNRIS